jgi:hypothetical protein
VNKTVTPKQLELTAGKSREELIPATAPHIDADSPAFKAADRHFDDFDWATDESVVLHEQRATAVYQNRFGGLVIRQEKGWDEEGDPFIVIGPENTVIFMEALAKRARE